MSKAVRSKLVDAFEARCRGQKALVFVDYRGLTSSQAAALRLVLGADRIRMTVMKNSSAHRAFDRIGWKDLSPMVQGPTAVIYGVDDPVLLSKRLVTWREKNKTLEIRGGCVDGKAVPPETIKRLAQMPSREQILAMVVGGVASPLTSALGTLHAIVRQFVATLQAVADRPAPPPVASQ